MSEKKIGFTVACVNEFAQYYNLSTQEAFQNLNSWFTSYTCLILTLFMFDE